MNVDYDFADEFEMDRRAEEEAPAIQEAINSLEAWKFEGSCGRAMMAAIDAGQCLLGKESTRDYWGNYIPSRTEVKAGTKGSFEFVSMVFGESHATKMAAL